MDKSWKPVLRGKIASRATAIALEVARRCSSQRNIQKSQTIQGSDGKPYFYWQSSSTAGGDAGIALLSGYIHTCFPKKKWNLIAHTYLLQSIESYDFRFFNLGLFGGITGLAFTTTFLSQDGTHYATLRKQLDDYLDKHISSFLKNASKADSFSAATYDLICGATGIAAYLISRDKKILSKKSIKVCHDVLKYLVTLTKPNKNGDYCFIPQKNIPLPERQEAHPHGYTDCGLAHGVPGIISVLSLAIIAGWKVKGLKEGLTSLVQWFTSQKIEDNYGINFPSTIEPSKFNKGVIPQGSRPSWCYGTPGTVRALYLAGQALHDTSLQTIAIASFESVLLRSRNLWHISSPNFCHGLGGILQVCLRMYHDTGSKRILVLIEKVVEELLSLYNPKTTFGFQDKNIEGIWYDNPRLLEGAPGTALALLAASQPVTPKWDRFFLLS